MCIEKKSSIYSQNINRELSQQCPFEEYECSLRATFLKEKGIKLGFCSGINSKIFNYHFAWRNNQKTISETSEDIDISLDNYKAVLTKIYDNRIIKKRNPSLETNRRKFDIVYKWLWSDFYEWLRDKKPLYIAPIQNTEQKQEERRKNQDGGDRRKNIKNRLLFDLKCAFINSTFDRFDDINLNPLDLNRLSHQKEFEKIIKSSLSKKDSSDRIIPKYIFLDKKEGSFRSYIQVTKEVVTTIIDRHKESKLGGTTIRVAIHEIAKYICDNYEVISDRRKFANYKKGSVISFPQQKKAS